MFSRLASIGLLLVAAGAAKAQDVAYRLDPTASDVHWRVYSAGAFARLGHNHVISAGALSGSGQASPADGTIRFEIEIPVEELVVDDPELRARYGDSFSSEPSADDIAGTRRNMLGDAVLAAEEHKIIRIAGTGPLRDGDVMLELTVQLVGRTVPLEVPARLTVGEQAIEAEGAFELTHGALGLKPFSVMMGALQVADRMDFTYRIRAAAEGGRSLP